MTLLHTPSMGRTKDLSNIQQIIFTYKPSFGSNISTKTLWEELTPVVCENYEIKKRPNMIIS